MKIEERTDAECRIIEIIVTTKVKVVHRNKDEVNIMECKWNKSMCAERILRFF